MEELGPEAVGPRVRVLFWRSPAPGNGADVCVRVFDELAPEFPDIRFTMAVRPSPREVPGIDELAARHGNVDVYRFPYPPGVDLARLVAESVCVLLPFRRLSIHPQLAIVESMATSAAVVATDLESIPEVITDGETGWLVPVEDAAATARAVRRLLEDPRAAIDMGRRAGEDVVRKWNWSGYGEAVERIYEGVTRRIRKPTARA
jgi:alpha-maltose-1-phosphate synthase